MALPAPDLPPWDSLGTVPSPELSLGIAPDLGPLSVSNKYSWAARLGKSVVSGLCLTGSATIVMSSVSKKIVKTNQIIFLGLFYASLSCG